MLPSGSLISLANLAYGDRLSGVVARARRWPAGLAAGRKDQEAERDEARERDCHQLQSIQDGRLVLCAVSIRI